MSRTNAAGSSITDLIGVSPVVKIDGGQPPVWRFPELSGTQTFKAGEMVNLSGGTTLGIGLTVPPTDASGFGIVGFAADDATGVTSAMKAVYVATPETIFVGNVYHATSASAQTGPNDLGRCYGLTSLSGRTGVDKGKTAMSTVLCRVVGLHEQDAVPSFYGRVYFSVIQGACQMYNNANWIVTSGSPGNAGLLV